jgi:hypothetical protein
MLRDGHGNKLFRKVVLTIRYPEDVLRPEKIVQKSEPHKGFGPDSVDQMLMQVADQLEARFPWWEFKMIPLSPEHRTARYTFQCVGLNLKYKPPEHQIASPTIVQEKTDAPAAPAV